MRVSPGLRVLVVGGVAAAALAVASPAFTGGSPGAVYVQTNTAPVNYVQAFTRGSDGALVTAGRYATGGSGNPAANPPLGIPFLDSAGSVTLSGSGKLLFVVNAGDNTVSSFRVGPSGLQLADTEPTLGSRPISSATSGDLLYVLNSNVGSASIVGFKVSPNGALTLIPGSSRPTSDPANDLPAQIKFDAFGNFLAVSDRGTDTIDTFTIGKGGAAGPAVPHVSNAETPYGIDFTSRDLMVVANENFSNVFASTVSSYDANHHGDITSIGVQSADSGAACWVVITKNGKFAYVTSPFTGQVVGFSIAGDGTLSSVVHLDNPGTAVLDLSLSQDGRFLYVLSSNGFASDQVLAYRVNKHNTLTKIGETAPIEGSAAGLAAW
jgi:6-phosphogluconolactonase